MTSHSNNTSYFDLKSILQNRNLSEEEKVVKREYQRNRYHMNTDLNEKLKQTLKKLLRFKEISKKLLRFKKDKEMKY